MDVQYNLEHECGETDEKNVNDINVPLYLNWLKLKNKKGKQIMKTKIKQKIKCINVAMPKDEMHVLLVICSYWNM